MRSKSNQSRYSYLRDSSVPDFPQRDLICVMDAYCAVCARGARWIARHDKAQAFSIVPLQSKLGSALLTHYGMAPSDPTSWLYLEHGQAFTSLDAFIRVGSQLGGVWRGLALLRIIPVTLQDHLYRTVATNRYRIGGHTDLCAMPDPEVQKRLLQ